MIVPARITSLYKTGGCYWCAMVYNSHTSTGHEISIEELAVLEVGMQLQIEMEWNEGGQGQRTKLLRPIKILKTTQPEWVEVKT